MPPVGPLQGSTIVRRLQKVSRLHTARRQCRSRPCPGNLASDFIAASAIMTTTTDTAPAVLRCRRPTIPESAPGLPSTGGSDSVCDRPRVTQLDLLSLPPELHLAVSEYLIYPDALSLKHTNRHFYSIVDTGIELKIDWLMERRRLHLECPNDRRCDLGSDLRFCRGSVPCV